MLNKYPSENILLKNSKLKGNQTHPHFNRYSYSSFLPNNLRRKRQNMFSNQPGRPSEIAFLSRKPNRLFSWADHVICEPEILGHDSWLKKGSPHPVHCSLFRKQWIQSRRVLAGNLTISVGSNHSYPDRPLHRSVL